MADLFPLRHGSPSLCHLLAIWTSGRSDPRIEILIAILDPDGHPKINRKDSSTRMRVWRGEARD